MIKELIIPIGDIKSITFDVSYADERHNLVILYED